MAAEGCDQVFTEKASGTTTRNRPELEKALAMLSAGDVFVVAEWSRATRSFDDGFALIAHINSQGALLKVLDRPYLDLTTPMGKAMIGIISAWAEDEAARNRQAAREGIKAAKTRGVRFGRRSSLTPYQKSQVKEMLQAGDSVRAIALHFNVSPSTIQRVKSSD